MINPTIGCYDTLRTNGYVVMFFKLLGSFPRTSDKVTKRSSLFQINLVLCLKLNLLFFDNAITIFGRVALNTTLLVSFQ